ncbi:MAG TPA: NAD(P)-binding domain-containing protein [Blastocatellia bacterium]|nr:NAD(P)-binding domain-containing protein [Blastocatellia bacterium]
MYDLIIVGSGPAGLVAALSAKRNGLDYLVFERGVVANTIYNYPIAKPLFSTSEEVELEQGALGRASKPTREEVLAHYNDLITREAVEIRAGEEVRSIMPAGEGLIVETNTDKYVARTVLVATGGFGRQRRLNVPGESAESVSYKFREAFPYAAKHVLVVGGGNSAAEAALFLADAGARVTLSLRRESLDLPDEIDDVSEAAGRPRAKIKPWVQDPLEQAANEGRIRIITSSEVVEIRQRSALLRVAHDGGGDIVEVECDHVFALIGADPDTKLLEEAGVEIAPDGRPVYNPQTFETSVSGLYVAGHITRELHMKNAVEVTRRVTDHIIAQVFERSSR